jgi:hypothetical protein
MHHLSRRLNIKRYLLEIISFLEDLVIMVEICESNAEINRVCDLVVNLAFELFCDMHTLWAVNCIVLSLAIPAIVI